MKMVALCERSGVVQGLSFYHKNGVPEYWSCNSIPWKTKYESFCYGIDIVPYAQPEKKFGFINQIIVRGYIRTVTFTGVQQYKQLFKMDTSNPTGQGDKPVGSAKANTSCRMADIPPKNDHRFL